MISRWIPCVLTTLSITICGIGCGEVEEPEPTTPEGEVVDPAIDPAAEQEMMQN